MKIWIVGAEGLLGKELVNLCVKKEFPQVTTGRQIDVTNFTKLHAFAKREKPTHIINCAAYTDVDRAEREKEKAFAINAEGPKHLAQLAKEQRMKLLHVSTDYVFDGQKKSAYMEEDKCTPQSVYAQSKYMGEKWALEELSTACIVRTSWLLGKGGKNFLSRLWSLLEANECLEIDDTQISRLTSIQDLSEALLQLMNTSGVWHFANVGEATRFQIATHVLNQSRARGLSLSCKNLIPIAHVGEAPRPLFSALATHKVEGFLGPIRHWKEVV